MPRRHECKYFKQWRNYRRCGYCGAKQFKIGNDWRPSMTLQQFADKWLPAVCGTKPEDMMTVRVAFPFEFHGHYETWVVAFRVHFQLSDVMARTQHGTGTRVDVMNGWLSEYEEDFVFIDDAAQRYYEQRTGRAYEIGDNDHAEMRAFIQSPVGIPKPQTPSLELVREEP